MAASVGRGDASYKYSDKEIAAAGAGMKKLATYRMDGGSGSVVSSQLGEVLKLIGKVYSDEQLKIYRPMWDKYNNGRIPVDAFLDKMRVMHDTKGVVQWVVKMADRNHDGFISEDEYQEILGMLAEYDPKTAVASTSYRNMCAEADANRDGKISLEECGAWIALKLGL